MHLFRSEEHISPWLEQNDHEPGATLSATKLCELAHAWWDTRLMPDWRPRTRSENQEILDRLGLVGPFWQLPR